MIIGDTKIHDFHKKTEARKVLNFRASIIYLWNLFYYNADCTG